MFSGLEMIDKDLGQRSRFISQEVHIMHLLCTT